MFSSGLFSIFYLRLVLGTLILTALFFPELYQPTLSYLWAGLYQSSFYRLSTFETILTVLSYSILEPSYTYKFARTPSLRIDIREGSIGSRRGSRQESMPSDRKDKIPKLPKMKRPSKRLGEIFLYVAPLLLLDLTLIKKFAGVPIQDIRASGGYSPCPLNDSKQGQISSFFFSSNLSITNISFAEGTRPSIAGNGKPIHTSFLLPTVHNFSWASPVQLVRALPPEPPTSRRLLLELLIALFIYDSLFFITHLAFHRLSFLQPYHIPHHTHAEIHPQVTNQLSIIERLSLVLLANFSLNIIGSHVLSRTIFVPIFVWLLIEVHSGMDLPWAYDKFLPPGWGVGAKEHAKHHCTGRGCYAPFFSWWDRALEWVARLGATGELEAKSI